MPPKAIRGDQMPPKAIRGDQWHYPGQAFTPTSRWGMSWKAYAK